MANNLFLTPTVTIPALDGWIFVDKPKGLASTAVVNIIKKMIPKGHKIGHGGTLDPAAEGLLPIAFGEATKTVQFVMDKPKVYTFGLLFGFETTTADTEGTPIVYNPYMPSKIDIEDILPRFIGKIMQIPPRFSALKINGVRAYNLVKSGKQVDIPPREVKIYDLKVLNYNKDSKEVILSATVGKGTYIRSLGVDLARGLGGLGHICYLRRERFLINKEILIANLNKLCTKFNYYANVVHAIEDMLDDISAYPLSLNQAKDIKNGITKNLSLDLGLQKGFVKATYNKKLIAVLDYDGVGYKILRGFNHYNIEEGD